MAVPLVVSGIDSDSWNSHRLLSVETKQTRGDARPPGFFGEIRVPGPYSLWFQTTAGCRSGQSRCFWLKDLGSKGFGGSKRLMSLVS